MSDAPITPESIHALLAEHLDFSLGEQTTGFQVRQTDPVVVTYNIAHTAFSTENPADIRQRELTRCAEILHDVGYVVIVGSRPDTQEPVLIIKGRR